MKVVVNGATDQIGKALAEQMVSDLNTIGYKASTAAALRQHPVPVRAELDQHQASGTSAGRRGTRTTRPRRTS